MNKFKNYGLWVAIAALGGLIVNDFGWLAPEKYDQYIDALFAILIAGGIISNPTSGQWFKDSDK